MQFLQISAQLDFFVTDIREADTISYVGQVWNRCEAKRDGSGHEDGSCHELEEGRDWTSVSGELKSVCLNVFRVPDLILFAFFA
jgi:hypothetical protein